MKGLLYKDFLTLLKTRILIIYIPIVMIMPLSSGENLMMMFFPCMFAATVPMSLLSLDEKSHWDMYSQTLPVTRAQSVHAKYIIGLCLVGVFSLLAVLSKSVMMAAAGPWSFVDMGSLLSVLIAVGVVLQSMVLPFIFKFGMEKGSMIYYAVLALFGVGMGVLYGFNGSDVAWDGQVFAMLPVVLPAFAGAVLALSWWLSVRFYTKREL